MLGSIGAAVVVEEDVDALVEAHERDRHRLVADREDDRIMALRQRELVDRHRDCVRLGRSAACWRSRGPSSCRAGSTLSGSTEL